MKILWIDNSNYEEDDIFAPIKELKAIKIDRIKTISDAYKIIQNNIDDYDFFVIDINLSYEEQEMADWEIEKVGTMHDAALFFSHAEIDEESETDDEELEYRYYEIAGIFIFMWLIEKRVDKNKIVFLTEKTKDENINKAVACLSVFIRKPNIFYKKENEIGAKFHKWLDILFIETKKYSYNDWLKTNGKDEKPELNDWYPFYEYNNYLTLRRGIINVIDALPGRTPPVTVTEDWRKSHLDGVAFMDNLRWLVANYDVPDKHELAHAYAAICDAIVKPFEKYYLDKISGGIYDKKEDDKRNYRDKDKHLVYLPYFLRNWLAHGVLRKSNTILEANDVAFIFILVINEIFDVLILNGEHKCEFVDLLPFDDKIVVENRIASLEEEYIGMSKYPKDPLLIIDDIGRRNIKKGYDFRQHLYASFLFPLRSLIERSRYIPSDNNNSQCQEKSYVINYKYKFDIDNTKRTLGKIALSRLDKIK